MPYVYGYLRVSAEVQLGGKSIHKGVVDDNTPIETHSHRIKQWWTENERLFPGYEFRGIFADPAVSSQKTLMFQRPQGSILLSYLQPGDIIVVVDLDRAVGTPKDFDITMEILKKKQVRLISLAMPGIDFTDCEGEMLGTVRAALKRYECKLTSRRMSIAYHSRVERGIVTGGFIPLGWRKHTKLVDGKVIKYFGKCKAERWWIRIMRWMRELDPKEWTQAKFKSWMRRTDYCRRGPRGNRGKFRWIDFRLADFIVRSNYPTIPLASSRQGYCHNVVSGVVFRGPRRSAPAALEAKKPASSDWPERLWRQGTRRPKAADVVRRLQCQEQAEYQASEASQEPDNLSDPATTAPSP